MMTTLTNVFHNTQIRVRHDSSLIRDDEFATQLAVWRDIRNRALMSGSSDAERRRMRHIRRKLCGSPSSLCGVVWPE